MRLVSTYAHHGERTANRARVSDLVLTHFCVRRTTGINLAR
jgi:hypothetical protein